MNLHRVLSTSSFVGLNNGSLVNQPENDRCQGQAVPTTTSLAYVMSGSEEVEVGYYGDGLGLDELPFSELPEGTWRYVGPEGFPAFDGNDKATVGRYVDGKLTVTDFGGKIVKFPRAA